MKEYDKKSIQSIIKYAKQFKGKTLKQVIGDELLEKEWKGKGNFGQLLEKYVFGYEPNSNAAPDFEEAGLELKSSPIKRLKNGEYRAKERLVLNIINYDDIIREDFSTSSFWKKNAHLLIFFYLFSKEEDFLNYAIKLIADWSFSDEDLFVIRKDWETIKSKVLSGKAHELSEGDTLYLGACTKGATAESSLRTQPNNTVKAKQRAYSLKQSYVNHIIASVSDKEPHVYGKLIKNLGELKEFETLENYVLSKFQPHYGKTLTQLELEFDVELNRKSKAMYASLTKLILGVEVGSRIEEFEKADIQVRTVRLREDNLPDQHVSFPAFRYDEILLETWEESGLGTILNKKFFFVFFRHEADELKLDKVKFWNMPSADLEQAEKVWRRTKEVVSNGTIIKAVGKTRRTNFPKSTESRVCHVRPHATNSGHTFPLPVHDKLTGVTDYTKHSFWLNAKYVRDAIYLSS